MRAVFQGRNPGGQRGITLLLTTVLLFVLLIMAALAVDLGMAYTGRTAAQHAADAAALAGAYTYVNQATLTGAERIEAATKEGAAVANKYNILGRNVTVSDAAQSASACAVAGAKNLICVDETRKRVTAIVSVPVNSLFARAMPGWSLLQVSARAVAEAAQNAAGERCLKPFYLSNDAISSEPPVEKGNCTKQSDDALKRCEKATKAGEVILGPNGLTEYALSYIAAQKTQTQFAMDPSKCSGPGCPVSLWDKNMTSESQWGVIDFTAGQGNPGEVISCTLKNCIQECGVPGKSMYKCGEPTVGMKTGQTTGQIIDELADLTHQGGKTPESEYQDAGSYLVGGQPATDSPAIIPIIVWDCTKYLDQCGTQPDVNVMGFARIFVNTAQKGGASTAFLISATDCGNSNIPGGGSVPIRLVNADPT